MNAKFPRRNQLELNHSAEIAIRKAMSLVESLGAHPLLTDSVTLLESARNKLADYIDTKSNEIEDQAYLNSKRLDLSPLKEVVDFHNQNLEPKIIGVVKAWLDETAYLGIALDDDTEITVNYNSYLKTGSLKASAVTEDITDKLTQVTDEQQGVIYGSYDL